MGLIVNSIDTETTYGLLLVRAQGIFDPPKIKPRLSHNWSDQHGLDMDVTSAVKFEARPFTFEGIIKASSKATYYTNVMALYTFLFSAGVKTVRADYWPTGKEFNVVFTDSDKFDQLTKWNDTLMAGKVILNALELAPTLT